MCRSSLFSGSREEKQAAPGEQSAEQATAFPGFIPFKRTSFLCQGRPAALIGAEKGKDGCAPKIRPAFDKIREA
jgi:hypothetical protein